MTWYVTGRRRGRRVLELRDAGRALGRARQNHPLRQWVAERPDPTAPDGWAVLGFYTTCLNAKKRVAKEAAVGF